MINPDYSNVQNDPTKQAKDMPKANERPVGVPQTKKDFKVLMRKDSESEEEDEGAGEGVKNPNAGEESGVKVVTKAAKPDAPKSEKASIFALSQTASKKPAAATDESPSDAVPTDPEQTEGLATEQMPDKPKTIIHPLLKAKEQAYTEQPRVAMANVYAEPAEKKVAMPADVHPKTKKAPMKEGGETAAFVPISDKKEDLANLSDQGADQDAELADFIKPEAKASTKTAPAAPFNVVQKTEKKDVEKVVVNVDQTKPQQPEQKAPVESKKAPVKEGGRETMEAVPFNRQKKDIGSTLDHGSTKEDEEKVVINPDLIKAQPQLQNAPYAEKKVGKPISGIRNSQAPEPKSIFTPNAFPASPSKERPVNAKFSQEQPDLTYVNPMHVGLQVSTNAAAREAPVARPSIHADIIKLIDQMVEKITTFSNEGKTDTTITIKNPAMFDGATLKITSFDSARGEFNVAFQNLKPEAQKLLQENMDGFKIAMQNKGFTVHIATASTVADTPIYTADAQAGGERRGGEKERDQQQEQGEE